MKSSQQGSGATSRSRKQVDPFYVSAAWKELRLKRIRLDKWHCTQCRAGVRGKRAGQSSPHVDHIIDRKDSPASELDIDNLQTLCHSCHSKKTKAKQLDKPAIGLDGYPLQQGK